MKLNGELDFRKLYDKIPKLKPYNSTKAEQNRNGNAKSARRKLQKMKRRKERLMMILKS